MINNIKIVPKKWGYEKIIINNDLYCGKILHINKGWYCSLHYHKNKSETFYPIVGTLKLQIEDEVHTMTVKSFSIGPNVKHKFWTEDEYCEFIEFSTHDEPNDSYRIEEACERE